MEFRATVVLGGKTATGIQVPDAVVEKLDAGKRPPVDVDIELDSAPHTEPRQPEGGGACPGHDAPTPIVTSCSRPAARTVSGRHSGRSVQ